MTRTIASGYKKVVKASTNRDAVIELLPRAAERSLVNTQVDEKGSVSAPLFTVAELLAIPHLHEARLVAGEAGLQNSIIRVNVMEVPDILAWVRPGEFLMTTGYPFRKKPELFHQLIPELVERGVTALGIKTKRFLAHIPEEAIEAAERFGLPLIELPPDIVFSDVVREVMERVLVLESSHLVILQNRIQTMSRLLLEGGGLPAFLDTLERMLGNPVAVIRPGDHPRFSSALRGEFDSEHGQEELLRLLSYDAIGLSDSRGFRYADTQATISGFQGQPQALPHPIRMYVVDIPMRHKRSALLVLIERKHDITPVDALTIDRMSPLAGLELMNAEAVREVEVKYVEQFLQDWLAGKLLTTGDILLRADVCGCKLMLDIPLQVAVLSWEGPSKPAQQLRELGRRIRLERFRGREFVLAAVHECDLTLIFPAQYKADDIFLSELRAICGSSLKALFVGKRAEGLERIAMSLIQARRARQAAAICKLSSDLVLYEELGIYSMLYLIPREEEWDYVLERFIDPLLASDRKGGRMIETLEAYFRCNGNVRTTSELLFTHYNTIVYRIEKIEQLLNIELNDSEVRLQLQLALKMNQMRDSN